MDARDELREIRKGFESSDDVYLRKIALEMAREAAVEHDKWKAQLSVIAYALSKLLTKAHFVNSPNWPRYKNVIISAIKDAEEGRERAPVERVERVIRKIDAEDGHFVKNIVDKARSKMASEAYFTGISLSLAALLFDADITDLSDYVGKTKVHDAHEPKIGIRERIEALRRLIDAHRG